MLVCGLMLSMAGMGGAQDDLSQELELPAWGTDPLSLYTVHAFEFVPIDSTTTYGFTNWMKFVSGGYPALVAGVHLPFGALVEAFHVGVCDDDGVADIQIRLWRCPSNPITDACTVAILLMSTSLSGCGYVNADGLAITVDNAAYTYFIEINPIAVSSAQRIDHVDIYYRLQISAPPGVATFADVPISHPFFQHIEALAASGITAGCGGGNYCPNSPITRGQMAVFMAKALGLHWAP